MLGINPLLLKEAPSARSERSVQGDALCVATGRTLSAELRERAEKRDGCLLRHVLDVGVTGTKHSPHGTDYDAADQRKQRRSRCGIPRRRSTRKGEKVVPPPLAGRDIRLRGFCQWVAKPRHAGSK